MMVGAYEAKTHLARLLDEVERGKTITITRHGVPVAQLVPAPGVRQRTIEETIDALKAFGRDKSLGPLTIRELIEEGRRY
ncbi:MAG: type II toxin-antitoxin system prevent-host-death family antitoxin [Sphaerobacter sp.]|nr:type II toxin-antitoxin system prevent-host-death family antitoxin [Sphaerobacter sp.]